MTFNNHLGIALRCFFVRSEIGGTMSAHEAALSHELLEEQRPHRYECHMLAVPLDVLHKRERMKGPKHYRRKTNLVATQ